jgi:hypothetical protein
VENTRESIAGLLRGRISGIKHYRSDQHFKLVATNINASDDIDASHLPYIYQSQAFNATNNNYQPIPLTKPDTPIESSPQSYKHLLNTDHASYTCIRT